MAPSAAPFTEKMDEIMVGIPSGCCGRMQGRAMIDCGLIIHEFLIGLSLSDQFRECLFGGSDATSVEELLPSPGLDCFQT